MSRRSDGKWAARQVGLILPRQNGKNAVLEALELYHAAHVPTTKLIIHSAHEQQTSAEHFVRLQELIDASDSLKRLVAPHGIVLGNGKEMIKFRNGCRIKFKTRTGGTVRGFSGDLVVLDEAFNLAERAISAMGPTMSARVDPQLWVTSSHPYPATHADGDQSKALRRFMRHGRAGAPSMAYIEYSLAA